MKYTAKHEIYSSEILKRNDNWALFDPEMICNSGFQVCGHPMVMEFVTKSRDGKYDPIDLGTPEPVYGRFPSGKWSCLHTLACIKRIKYSSSDITDGSVIITKDYVDDMLKIWDVMHKKSCPHGSMKMVLVFMYQDCYYEFDACVLLHNLESERYVKTRMYYNQATCKSEKNTVYAIPMNWGIRYKYKATTKEQRDELYTKYEMYDMIDKPADKVTVKHSVISPLI